MDLWWIYCGPSVRTQVSPGGKLSRSGESSEFDPAGAAGPYHRPGFPRAPAEVDLGAEPVRMPCSSPSGRAAGRACSGRGQRRTATGDDHQRHSGVRAVAAGVAGAQCEHGTLGGEESAVADPQPLGGAGEPVVQRDVQGEPRRGHVLDDHVVRARDEGATAPARALGLGDPCGEVDRAAVAALPVGHPPQPHLEGGVEMLHPLQGAPVREVLGRGDVSASNRSWSAGSSAASRGGRALSPPLGRTRVWCVTTARSSLGSPKTMTPWRPFPLRNASSQRSAGRGSHVPCHAVEFMASAPPLRTGRGPAGR